MFALNRVVVVALVGLVAGCSSGSERAPQSAAGGEAQRPSAAGASVAAKAPESRRLTEMDMRRVMQRAGFELTPLDKTDVVPSDYRKFPAEPRSMLSVRVSDDQRNSTTMTLVQFDSADQAARIRGVNGFAVHNWFVLGIVSNYFRDKIVGAAG